MEKCKMPTEEDTGSSGSSVPDDLNLIDGEIEIVQRSKLLTEEDKIMPGTTLHSIKVHDRDRTFLAKCSTVSTDWAIELESSFLGEGQLLVRKVSPGLTFSHIYDNQGAFDRVTIRAHLTARNGGKIFDGYFCRSQKLSNPLERSHAWRQLGTDRSSVRSHFKKLGGSNSLPGIEQQPRVNDSVKQISKTSLQKNPKRETTFHVNMRVPCEEVSGQLSSAPGDNEPIQMNRGLLKFNEGKSGKGGPDEKGATAQTTSNRTDGPPWAVNKKTPKVVDLPDPKTVPKAVLEVRDFGDVLANKKVIEYLNHLDDGAATINHRLENNMEVSEKDIKSMNSASSAILREYGYDFPESSHSKNRSWRRSSRKTHERREGNESSSGESDVSYGELKSEVVKRALEGRDFSELLGLLNNSKEWKESEVDDLTPGGGVTGKIERTIQQQFSA